MFNVNVQCQYIYISKIRHLFLNELYFGFFQTFEDSIYMLFTTEGFFEVTIEN